MTDTNKNENENLEPSVEQVKTMTESNPSNNQDAITGEEMKADPHADREADKYENPIPSREFIIELLEKEQKNGVQASEKLLHKILQDKGESYDDFIFNLQH